MALVTIIKFLLTWFLGNAIFVFLTPILRTMLKDSGLYNNMPPEILAYGDTLYYMWIAMIFIIPLTILIISWREAEAKARGQY